MELTIRRSVLRALALFAVVFVLSSMGGGAQGGSPTIQEGDLFVGAGAAVDPNFGGILGGAIKRVRGGSVTTYCQSPFSGGDRWNTPHDVLVDSQGRVVFLAEIGPLSYTHGVYGLLRCNGPGTPIEKLAVFGAGGPLVPIVDGHWRGYPVPFPDMQTVGNVGGLHLTRKSTTVIDDDVLQGRPRTVKEDVYAMVVSTPSGFESYRYKAESAEWEEGAQVVVAPRYVWSGFMPDATYYGGATYSALEDVLGRDREPFRIDVKGNIGSVQFGLRIGLFGGYNEVGGGRREGSFEEVAATSFVLDNIRDPNRDGGCPAGAISTAVPAGFDSGTYAVPAGFAEVAMHRLFGLVVTSNSSAAGTPYLTQFDGPLLDDNPFNDSEALFLHPGLGCNAQRKLVFEPILPFSDPEGLIGNTVTRLAAATEGLFGTQVFAGNVVQVREGERVTLIAGGLIRPTGIAAYPANVPAGQNVVVVIRIDSPVNAIVTDASGKRIGVDAGGAVVNDFGPLGYVGEPGEPRLIAIRNPEAGAFSVDTFGTGTGPYGVHVYSVDTDREDGEHIVTRGTASPGSVSEHGFTLDGSGAIAFHAEPPPLDAVAPVSAATLSSPANAAGWHRTAVIVALASADEEGGSGAKEIVYSAAGALSVPETVVPGTGVSVPVGAEGFTTISFFARDNAGNTESVKTIAVRVDRTPPQITGTRSPEPNAMGWNSSDVTVTFACSDDLSGIATCGDSPQVVSSDGLGQSRSAMAVDVAGNEASAVIGMINIDRAPPTMSCTATPDVLWPPNHTMIDVRISVHLADLLSGAGPFVLLSAVSSEPDEAPGDIGVIRGDVQGFTPGTPDTEGRLRSERAGGGPGRVYTLTYQGSDAAGNAATCTATVTVPHDQRR